MKAGTRAVGVAESYRGTATEPGSTGQTDEDRWGEARSTLASAVVRADRVVDGLAYGTCTVGGEDATAAVRELLDDLDREDVRYVLIAGVALAWFNLLDLTSIADAIERPVLTVSFEDSPGLEPAIRREFDGAARKRRLARYRSLPERRRLAVGEHALFVRAVGLEDEDPGAVLSAFTPEGGRPEPLRVARLAARAADDLRADS